jgi:hypothetical protein
MKYAIEGLGADGQWTENNIIAGGHANDVNRFDSRDEAESVLVELAEIFSCSEDDLRIINA